MRILTVRQPWAWAIIHGQKDVENRVRNIAGSYRGPVAIHVAHANAAFAPSEVTPSTERRLAEVMAAHRNSVPDGEVWPWYRDRGAIIGVVDLVDVHQAGDAECSGLSKWAEDAGFHLCLSDPRPLFEPIPYKGALGLRTLDEATAIRVWEAIA